MAFIVAQPADACRQPLEFHVLSGGIQPVVQVGVVWEEFFEGFVCDADILWIARQCYPTEWAKTLAEQRPDVGWYETWEVESSLVARLAGLIADRVTIVEDLGSGVLEFDHGFNLCSHAFAGFFAEAIVIGLCFSIPLIDGEFQRQIG